MRKVVVLRAAFFSLLFFARAFGARRSGKTSGGAVKNDLPTALMAATRHTQIHFTHILLRIAQKVRGDSTLLPVCA
jgi:hypothetical protein